MKVLVVIDSLSFGGAENVLVTLADHADAVGLEFEVLALAPASGGRGEWLPRLRTAGLRTTFLGLERLLEPSAVPRLAAAVRASGCDVVHAHLETASTLAPLAARLAGRPAICTFHHVPVPLRGRDAVRERLAVAVASRSDLALFVSEASRSGFAGRYPRSARAGRWEVLHNGVDLRRFRPSSGHDSPAAGLGLPVGAPVVALVGHMRPGKGHDVAVAAWPTVVQHVPDAHLLLVGGGPLEQHLRAQAAALGVGRRVVFAGVRDDVPALLRAADLVVLPTSMEALPTVLLEAAASGVAAVATAVGGVPEVLVDGETGWLVDEAQPELFADTIRRALGDPGERARRGAAARERAHARFGAADWARRLRACYDDTLPPSRRRTA